ncbi:MAG: hypothetical protein LW809_00880 [Vampirovibrionales bacterium]|jgi:hypothetical protein|nr:hypothetical protein [Vampirovibrionales bacterium]
MTYSNKRLLIVCIAIQLIFNFCFIWYLADTRKTTHSQSIVDLSDVESRLSDVESSINTLSTESTASTSTYVPAPASSSNNNWYEESQRKQQLDRIEQEQQRVKREQLWKD